MSMTEKVAYLRGLLEGMDLDKDKKEVKIIEAVIDVLGRYGLPPFPSWKRAIRIWPTSWTKWTLIWAIWKKSSTAAAVRTTTNATAAAIAAATKTTTLILTREDMDDCYYEVTLPPPATRPSACLRT